MGLVLPPRSGQVDADVVHPGVGELGQRLGEVLGPAGHDVFRQGVGVEVIAPERAAEGVPGPLGVVIDPTEQLEAEPERPVVTAQVENAVPDVPVMGRAHEHAQRAVTARRPADSGFAPATDPDGYPPTDRRRGHGDAGTGEEFSRLGLPGPQPSERLDGLVATGAPAAPLDAGRVPLGVIVTPDADAEDDPSVGEVAQGGERLRHIDGSPER